MLTDADILGRVLHHDADMIILNKPAGIAVHAGSGRNDALDIHFSALTFGLDRPPALAHRLDRDTSGCLVLGRHRKALARLGKLFQQGAVEKTYWAVVAGVPDAVDGMIDRPLARRSHDRRSWIMKIATASDPAAEPARTRWRLLQAGDGFSLVALTPLTGRTHQLRVHCESMGWPIAGDPIYGGDRARALARHLHLHARRVVVPLLPGKPPVDVTAPVPDHMLALIRFSGFGLPEGG